MTTAQPPLRVVVAGASGRMGQSLIRAVAAHPDCTLAAALERPGSAELGSDAGSMVGLPPLGLAVSADPDAAMHAADVVLDFTTPAATLAFAARTARHGIIHVIGTTGLSEPDMDMLRESARQTVIVQSGNMSVGVNLLAALVRQAAKALGSNFDVEIVEMHHRMKVDAPSGTALLLGEAAAQGRGVSLAKARLPAREGHTGARPADAIGFASLRGGTVVGEHTAVFAGHGERLELRHVAEDRTLFAEGALKAALWGRGRAPGLYSMADVLGISA